MKICCSFSFTKLMQNCSKPFFPKISNPYISSIPMLYPWTWVSMALLTRYKKIKWRSYIKSEPITNWFTHSLTLTVWMTTYFHKVIKQSCINAFSQSISCIQCLLHIKCHINCVRLCSPLAVKPAASQFALQIILLHVKQECRICKCWKK